MPAIERSALVARPPGRMFDLVNDIERYPEFMPGCLSARVLSRSDSELVGRLCLGRAGVRQCFTTRNRLRRPESIEMELVEGNFARFRGRWRFEALGEAGCRVSLSMDFALKPALLDRTAGGLLAGMAGAQVDALVARARGR